MLNCYGYMNKKTQMEKKINLGHFLREEKQPALGILEILKEAFKTTIKNGKLFLSIAFFMFIYYSLLGFTDHLVAPVYSGLISKHALKPKDVGLSEIDPTSYKANIKEIRLVIIYELIALAFSFLILMISLAAIIHSTHEAYTAKVLGFKEMLLSIRTRWKRPVTTTLWMFLISFVSIVLFLIVFALTVVMTEGYLLISLIVGLIIFGICFYLYLSAVWIFSLVVSVLEENSSGMKAIDRARELMKGKRLRGCVLMLILVLASLVTLVIYGTFALLAISGQKSRLIWLAISALTKWSICLEKFFAYSVFTMFYYECKRNHPVEDKTSGYLPLSPAEI